MLEREIGALSVLLGRSLLSKDESVDSELYPLFVCPGCLLGWDVLAPAHPESNTHRVSRIEIMEINLFFIYYTAPL